MRFLVILCLISLLLSVAIISATRVNAYSNTCVSPNLFPTVTGTPIIPPATQPSVVLNEVLLSPHTGWNCAYQTTPNGLQNAWIELYNLLGQPLDLYAARACIDTGPNTLQACLTLGSIIPAHGFFTFFPYPNKLLTQSAISTLRLLLAYVPVDQVNIPALPPDISYARMPDGTGKWQPDTAPTINSSNTITILPSPSPTPKRSSKTKSATHSTTKHTQSTQIGNNTTTNTALDQNGQAQDNTGKQIPWHNLQFPTSLASSSTLNKTTGTNSTPSLPSSTTENVPQKILFSLIGVAGLLSLWWGWRRFSQKNGIRRSPSHSDRRMV